MRRLSTLLLAICSTACGTCGDPKNGPAVTEWISQGTGEANVAPLLPLRAGTGAFGGGSLLADAVIQDGDNRLLRIQIEGYGPNTASPAQAEFLLGEGVDGVELHGREGRRTTPVLLVPKTVRVGMRWRATVPGQPASEFEIISREQVDTALGPGVRWTIKEFLEKAEVARLDLLEGVGLVSTGAAVMSVKATRTEGTLDDGPLAPELEATPLTPFVVGPKDFGDNLYLMNLGVVVPAGASRGTLIVKGTRSCAFGSDDGSGQCPVRTCFDVGASGAGVTQSPARVQGYHVGNGCNEHLISSKWELTNDSSGALVLPTGVHWVPRGLTGGLRNPVVAAYADPLTSEARLLVYSLDPNTMLYRASWADYLPDGTSFSRHGEQLSGQWLSPLFKNNEGPYRPSRGWTLTPPGPVVELAGLGEDRALFVSRLEGDVLAPLEPVTTLGGAFSWTASIEGQQLVVVSAGGRIDRLVRADGSLVRESIGRVELPEGESIVAAAELAPLASDRLLVATWKPPARDDAHVQGHFGTVSFYTTPRQAPVRWAWPKGLGVVARQRSQDVVVCWPSSPEPLVREGWTLGGTPAKEVLEVSLGRCALIVRDVEADPVLGGRSLAELRFDEAQERFAALRHDVEGPVPGVGRMRIGVAGSRDDALLVLEANGPMAPLAGGGYATTHRLLGPGGLETSLVPGAPVGASGVADRAGAGMWVARGQAVHLVGPSPRSFPLATPVNDTHARFADSSGGLVLQVGAEWRHFSATGVVTELPAAPPGAPWAVRRRSGELCRVDGPELVCVDGAGQETARDLESDYARLEGVLADDSVLVRVQAPDGSQTTSRWVPGASPVAWERRILSSLTFALDGTAWCVLHDPDVNTYAAGQCTAAGFTEVDLKTPLEQRSWMVAHHFKDVYRVIAGEKELFVESFGCLNGCYSRWTRLPWP